MPRPLAVTAALIVLTLALAAMPAGARVAAPGAAPREAPPARPAWLRGVETGGPPRGAAAEPQGEGVYIVVLDEPPLASYGGGLAGLAATSPRAAGGARLDASSPAATAYLGHLERRQGEALAGIAAAVGRPVAPGYRYRYALNGLALTLTPAEAAAAAALPGVRLVQRAAPRSLANDSGPALIGAAQRDLRPAIFAAALMPAGGAAERGAGGHAIVTYDAATARLGVQLDYRGLPAPPTGARLVSAAPGPAAGTLVDLTPRLAAADGLFGGTLTLAFTAGLSAVEFSDALLDGDVAIVVDTAAAPGALSGRLRPVRGEGVVAGVVDGGIAADSPSFAARGDDGYEHRSPRGDSPYLGVCAPGSDFSPPFPCSPKLIGAYTFPATAGAADPAGRPSPFDDNGHGSHTASTLAGNVLAATSVGDTATGPIAGVAPHAALIAYDVCGTAFSGTCPMEAILAAIDRAAADGVQVINFSISGLAGDPWQDADALAFLGALDAGVLPAVAAGNGGPDAGTIGAPANAPWVMAVAASTHARRYTRALTGLAGGAAPPPGDLVGAGFGADEVAPRPLLDAAALGDALGAPNPFCLQFGRDADLGGAIVICRHLLNADNIARNAAAAGAAGVVIIWPADVGDSAAVEPLPLPAVHLGSAAGDRLLAWLAAGSGQVAGIGAGGRDAGGVADTVAWFSARGPSRRAPAVLKPDLTAPGVNILAASTERVAGQPDYAFLSGTSMAAPHAAGAAVLLRELHPDWTPTEIRSALMTTATPELTTGDAAGPATPHDVGAGRLRVDMAARAGLLLDERGAAFLAADPSRGGDPAQLNLPSLSSGACLELCVFTRTLRSALPAAATWTASTAGGPGLRLTVRPERFTIAPGAAQTIVITAHAEPDGYAPAGSYRFGAVTLTEQQGLAPQARLPVALDAPSSILPPRVVVRALTPEGAADTPELRTVSAPGLTLRVLGPERGERRTLGVRQDPTPWDPLDGPQGVVTTTIDVPAGSPRVLVAVEQSTASDLDLFVYADGEGGPADGAPQREELICAGASSAAAESCDLTLDGGGPRRLLALVQGFVVAPAVEASVDLTVAVVPPAPSGVAWATGPAAVAAGEPFAATIGWAVAPGRAGAGRYVGALQVSSGPEPERAGDLGVIPLDLLVMPERSYVPMARR